MNFFKTLINIIQHYLVHLNINFANGPVIQGRKFKKATVPFSTRGELDDHKVCKNCVTKKCECTHMRKLQFDPIYLLELIRQNPIKFNC